MIHIKRGIRHQDLTGSGVEAMSRTPTLFRVRSNDLCCCRVVVSHSFEKLEGGGKIDTTSLPPALFYTRTMKLLSAFASVALTAAVAPPRIELNLAQMGTAVQAGQGDTDWTERCPASANTNVQNCPFPEAKAFDHNNNEIGVREGGGGIN
jgi:hypothetical protein